MVTVLIDPKTTARRSGTLQDGVDFTTREVESFDDRPDPPSSGTTPLRRRCERIELRFEQFELWHDYHVISLIYILV